MSPQKSSHGVCQTFTSSCILPAFEAVLTCNCCYLGWKLQASVNTVSFEVTPSVSNSIASQDPVQISGTTVLHAKGIPDNCKLSRNCQGHCRMCPQTLANFGFVNVLLTGCPHKGLIFGRVKKNAPRIVTNQLLACDTSWQNTVFIDVGRCRNTPHVYNFKMLLESWAASW